MSLLKLWMMFLVLFLSTNAAADLHFVHFKASDHKTRSEIAKFVHIDQVVEDSVYSIVNDADYARVLLAFGNIIVESHPYVLPKLKSVREIAFPSKDRAYHTYTELTDKLANLARKYPDALRVFSLGKTAEGREIWAAELYQRDQGTPENAFIPGSFMVGAHHAREHLSTEVPLGILDYMLANKDSDGQVKKILSSRKTYFVPMLNPDGAMHDISGTRYKYWRKNRTDNKDGSFGVDLNRNYDSLWGQGGSSNSSNSDVYMGPAPFSEPESLAIKHFIEGHPHIRTMISFHTYGEMILYPWGGKQEGVGGKDEVAFKAMAKQMSKWNGYKAGLSAELYVATGDTCDWAYDKHGIFCFTFELSPGRWGGGGFYPGNIIDRVTKENIKPSLYLIEKAGNPY
jgi:carboxypeptidase T